MNWEQWDALRAAKQVAYPDGRPGRDAARWRPDGYTDEHGVFRYPPSPHNFAFPATPAHETESDDGGN